MGSRTYAASAALAIVGALAFGGVANAETIGNVTPPSGASGGACFDGFAFVQAASDPSASYTVPADGDMVTDWQINTGGATAGTDVTFLVLHPTSPTTYDVVGADTETIPDPLPAGGIASFTLATPIVASAGDALGLWNGDGGVSCFFSDGLTPTAAHIDALTAPVGRQHLTEGAPGPSPGGFEMNVAATVAPGAQDVAVATTASPAGATAGQFALLSSSVANAGPLASPITFTDSVPAGLAIVSAVVGNGACGVTGQTVTCTITNLAAGQSTPVDIVVAPAAAGTYRNAVSVAAPVPDPNAANNTASASLVVAAAPAPPKCVVPNLKKVSSSAAKKLLKLLGCKVGKTKKAHSSSVAKGLVVKTSPKAGTYAAGKTVSLTVSSGKAKKKHRK